jgi:integrase
MSIKKIKDHWFCQIDRKGVPRVRKSFATLAEAAIFERDYLAKAAAKPVLNADRRKLSELVAIWFKFHGMNLSDGERRRSILLSMAVDLGDPVACELTPSQFLDYRYRCTYSNGTRIASKTFNNRQGYLMAVYNKLRKLQIIDYVCPILDVDAIKVHERQLSYLSGPQIELLFDRLKHDCRNTSVWWIAQVCIRTGARWGEAETLRRKQLHNERITFEFTKSKKVRTVPLDAAFYASLLEFARGKNPDDRIFKDGITAFNRCVARCDLEFPAGQKTHILRHSFASYFVMNGGDILSLQRILGHSDIKMTLRYAHLAPDHLFDAVKFNPLA